MASFANSPVQLVGNPKQNARIVGKRTVSISSIAANEEILVSYGREYKYPLLLTVATSLSSTYVA